MMARSKVDQVVEHRLTLGKFERTELKQSLDLMQKRQQNALYKEYAIGAATGAAALGTAYALSKMPGIIKEIGALFGTVYAYAEDASDAAGNAIDAMTQPSNAGTPSYWGALIHRLNPLVSAVEWDIRHNSDEQFMQTYGMTKAQYIMFAPADNKPNPDNYCNGMYNCGIPEQQEHYEKYGNGFGL